jgi:hypothetical protein
MQDRSKLIPAARSLLKLARADRVQARAAMANLSVEEQVATLCEAPIEFRGSVLDLVPIPEQVIPLIPEAELCFLCKHVGVHDASWILQQATREQIVACMDLDAWTDLRPDIERLDTWMDALAEAGEETIVRGATAMDPEMLALYLRDHVIVKLKPAGDEDWEPPDGTETLEGQFYFGARKQNDDIASLKKLLHALFTKDYWLYFRMMQSVDEELQVETEEWALRWRTGRLEDLGFPAWDRAMRIYGFMRDDKLADIPIEPATIDSGAWSTPVWITELPIAADETHSLFRAVAELDTEARSRFFYAFIRLANHVAVADRLDLGDAETLPGAIEKAARVASIGLELIASRAELSLPETLRRVQLDRLFRVGVNASPSDERPSPIEADDEADEAQNAGEAS